ncbi:MAG: response regulator transcription factor [Chitinophagaceae bacterium]
MLLRKRILLIEDEPKLSQVIQEELERKGYVTDASYNGETALQLFLKQSYSLVLLDINLPDKNGFTLCKEFRETNKQVPIIMLTALGDFADKMDAFNLGADDYITKPFHFDELFARINVFLKRSEKTKESTEIIEVEDLVVNLTEKSVTRNNQPISLTLKEFLLITLLCKNRGRIVSKQEILEKVWDLKTETGNNSIEVYISFLRNKIDKPFSVKLIHTKPGFGYFVK